MTITNEFWWALNFWVGVVSSSEITKVNVSSSMVHGTPVFLEIYQLQGCGVTQCINLALILPPAPPPQCSFCRNSMTVVAFPIFPLSNRNKIPLHCNRIRAPVVERFLVCFFFIAALIVLSIPKEVRKPSVNTFQRCLVLQMELLGTHSFSII